MDKIHLLIHVPTSATETSNGLELFTVPPSLNPGIDIVILKCDILLLLTPSFMKLLPKNFLLVFIAVLLISSSLSNAQDAQKEKVIATVQGELSSFIRKDKAAWEKYWVQTPEAMARFVGPNNYVVLHGWDSIRANVKEHFETPGEGFKAVKSDFNVSIKGNIALVSLVETSDEMVMDQTLVLEKVKNEWKFLKMTNIARSNYANTDFAIERNINTQGYKLMATNRLDDAIKLFMLNTELFPKAWNTWDSLAEAFMKKGENDLAIGYYKKSIQLNAKNEHGKKVVAELTKDNK